MGKKYNGWNIAIAFFGGLIPLINMFSGKYIRIGTTILSVLTGMIIYVLKLKNYRTAWKNYRNSAECIKSELRKLLMMNEQGEVEIEVVTHTKKLLRE